MIAAKPVRRLHRAGAFVVLLPLLVVLASGLLLQVRQELDWVQPERAQGVSGPPAVTLSEALAAARSANVGITDWNAVESVELRPDRGVVSILGTNRQEVQIDATTGAVLAAGPRRTGLLAAIHEGSWFRAGARFWVFLPAALVLFGMWCSGLYLWLLPHRIRARKRRDPFA